jgi:hypothetical protein
MIAQVGRLGQHSGKFQSRFVTEMQRKCRMWTDSGVKKKFIGDVMRKYGVRVK